MVVVVVFLVYSAFFCSVLITISSLPAIIVNRLMMYYICDLLLEGASI